MREELLHTFRPWRKYWRTSTQVLSRGKSVCTPLAMITPMLVPRRVRACTQDISRPGRFGREHQGLQVRAPCHWLSLEVVAEDSKGR